MYHAMGVILERTRRLALAGALVLAGVSGQAAAEGLPTTPAPENAKVYFIEPADGAEVTGDVVVKFGLSGMGVAPAGVDMPKTGHHHLLINAKQLPPAGKPMGTDVKHFGGGQTEVRLTLPKGQHTLQLIMGDKYHIPHEPMIVSKKITITVK